MPKRFKRPCLQGTLTPSTRLRGKRTIGHIIAIHLPIENI